VAAPLHAHVSVGDAPQFALHQRDQPVQTRVVPGPPAEEKFSYWLLFPRLHNFFPPVVVSVHGL
jgi:hypothetical protein